jgi:hypothetical protein
MCASTTSAAPGYKRASCIATTICSKQGPAARSSSGVFACDVPTGVCAQPAHILARIGDAGGEGCETVRVTESRTRLDRIAIA